MNTNSIFNSINQAGPLNAKSVLRSIRLIYFSLILGILTFLVVTFLIAENPAFVIDKSDPILFASLILFLTAIPAGILVAQTMWKRIDAGMPLKDKLIKYQTGFLLRMATCEGVALFSIVGFLLSDNLSFLILTAAALLIIFYNYPSIEKLEMQLALNQSDVEELTKER